MAEFTKGTKVAVVADWDCKGTTYIRRAVVHSCGAKVLRLQLENGETFKRAYNAAEGFNHFFRIVEDDTNEALEALALVAANGIIEYTRSRLERCLKIDADEGYRKAIQKDIDALHEPRFIWR